jgi:CheY-like chemotaxis protein
VDTVKKSGASLALFLHKRELRRFVDWILKATLRFPVACSILQARPEWQVISEACDGLQAVQRASELRPDIILLDIRMPILNGLEAAERIRECCPIQELSS